MHDRRGHVRGRRRVQLRSARRPPVQDPRHRSRRPAEGLLARARQLAHLHRGQGGVLRASSATTCARTRGAATSARASTRSSPPEPVSRTRHLRVRSSHPTAKASPPQDRDSSSPAPSHGRTSAARGEGPPPCRFSLLYVAETLQCGVVLHEPHGTHVTRHELFISL